MRSFIFFLGCGVILCSGMFTRDGNAQVLDPVIEISAATMCQEFSQVAYNYNADEYCVVWEDHRTNASTGSDIYGQIVRGDGTLRGENFPICTDTTHQYWPHIDYDPNTDRYLVVFEDSRNGNGSWMGNYDIYGALLDRDGRHIMTSTSEADTCFAITKDSSATHYPAVAFNHKSQTYLVVWADYRNSTTDIYGQRVSPDGELISPPAVPDVEENFPICDDGTKQQDVPDISYSHVTGEWFVVFSFGDWMNCDIYGQRVNRDGSLLNRQGLPGAEAILITEQTGLDVDWVQPRVQFNSEYISELIPKPVLGECLVIWHARETDQRDDIDLECQRLAFLPDSDAVDFGVKENYDGDNLYFAVALDTLGHPITDHLPNYALCNAEGYQNAPDITFSFQDNEFAVCWGDERRTKNWDDPDFYCQPLRINPDSAMVWLDAERTETIAPWQNVAVDTTDNYEGGNLVGAAHSSKRNEFFFVYTFVDTSLHRGADLNGRRFSGTPPTSVENRSIFQTPERMTVYQNYPNPFNPETRIRFYLPTKERVTIEIFNITGQKINTVVNDVLQAGEHEITWRGSDAEGNGVTSGLYFYTIRYQGSSYTQKMMVIH